MAERSLPITRARAYAFFVNSFANAVFIQYDSLYLVVGTPRRLAFIERQPCIFIYTRVIRLRRKWIPNIAASTIIYGDYDYSFYSRVLRHAIRRDVSKLTIIIITRLRGDKRDGYWSIDAHRVSSGRDNMPKLVSKNA